MAVARILAGLDVSGRSAVPLVRQLVDACARRLPVSGVGLVIMDRGQPVGVVAASDRLAQGMEDLQFTLGEGPCVEAAHTGRPVLLPDLERSGVRARWPGFVPEALDRGVHAVFALPLRVGAIALGVLDLYRDRPGGLDAEELQCALDFAEAALTVVLHVQSAGDGDGGVGPDALDEVRDSAGPGAHGDDTPAPLVLLDDRAEVHQATGVVAVQAGVGLAQALVLLRARAFGTGRPVVDVARDVLARATTFAPEDDG
ncbi:GAF and ANTAR domain-containing protein [Aquipuribacter sp. SD81]|uniref:GAF and ANTAR domain-containing protein n=1 Tax=Aquipuribacter sp. SD81 TaxID=3127703 RepID=UPI003018671B